MDAWVVDENAKGLLDRPLKTVKVNADKVSEALTELRQLLPDDPEPADGTVKRWRMDEVELTVEVTGEGSIKLLGGATVGLTGGIKVLFKRVD
ncbi:hypothetical protein [Actinoplanes sp. NPDC026619]|uniref:Pepco domain-containing protein n=1 Tax=Actinoplanes sp. NPDC026619 TaxID=3155798 RepID=UPI0033D54A13